MDQNQTKTIVYIIIGTHIAYTLVVGSNVEMRRAYMLVAIFWTLGFHLMLPAKIRVSFLSKLSELYSTLFRIKGQGISKEPRWDTR